MDHTERVSTAMTTEVVTIDMDSTILDVRRIFDGLKFHHLIVTEQGRTVGVVSDRDLLRHLSCFVGSYTERRQDTLTLHRHVHQIMTRRVIWVSPETPIAVAAEMMLNHGISCLPVLDREERVLGIVTWRDLLPWAIGALATRRPEAA